MKRASSPSTSIFSIKKKILENVKSVLLSLSFFSLLSPAGVPPVPKLPSISTLVPVFTAFLYLGLFQLFKNVFFPNDCFFFSQIKLAGSQWSYLNFLLKHSNGTPYVND